MEPSDRPGSFGLGGASFSSAGSGARSRIATAEKGLGHAVGRFDIHFQAGRKGGTFRASVDGVPVNMVSHGHGQGFSDFHFLIPELVVGPFGAAIIEELPPAAAVMSHGIRSWEVRAGSGRVQTIENPLERATHDADRVRAWLSGDEADHVIKVYAAVVGTDARVERSSACAVIAPEQVAGWLTSLPPQPTLDEGRRDRIVRTVRAAL